MAKIDALMAWPWSITRSIKPVNWLLCRPAAAVHYMPFDVVIGAAAMGTYI